MDTMVCILCGRTWVLEAIETHVAAAHNIDPRAVVVDSDTVTVWRRHDVAAGLRERNIVVARSLGVKL